MEDKGPNGHLSILLYGLFVHVWRHSRDFVQMESSENFIAINKIPNMALNCPVNTANTI